jgi:hypothetical protein
MVRNVAISPEFFKSVLTLEQETDRMDNLVKNKGQIGVPFNTEIIAGQKAFFPSAILYQDSARSEFTKNKKVLYAFALITFMDEKSGDREVVTEVCARLDPGLLSWTHCFGPHNRTVR